MGIQGIQSSYKKPFVYSLTPRIGIGAAGLAPEYGTAAGTPGTYKGTFSLHVSPLGDFYLYFAYPEVFAGGSGISLSRPQGWDLSYATKTNSVAWVGAGTIYAETISGRVIPFVMFRTQPTRNTTPNTWVWSWTAS